MIVPLVAGTVFALAIIALLHWTRMDRDRATAPILLVAIALFYPVFAVENGDASEVTLHAVVALAFLGSGPINRLAYSDCS